MALWGKQGLSRLALAAAASWASYASGGSALAQDATESEEIIVTATKREERLQDVPIAVTAFGEEQFEQLRPDSLSDLGSRVPNMYLPPANESQTQYITLRGLGPGVTRSSGRSVGVYIDGAFSSADNLTNIPVSDLASIEVLRGPQGTLFGRDTIGGAINVTTRAPSDEFSGFAELEYGSYERLVLSGGLDIPLSEVLALRVSARQLNYGGHIYNEFTGDRADGVDQFSGRAQLYETVRNSV
jgi:iron complex outermembrane receptor protein